MTDGMLKDLTTSWETVYSCYRELKQCIVKVFIVNGKAVK